MMKIRYNLYLFICLFGLFACSSGIEERPDDQPVVTEQPENDQLLATIQDSTIIISGSTDIKAEATIVYLLPAGCSELIGIDQKREGDTIYLEIRYRVTAVCETGGFDVTEQTVPLDISGYGSGTYILNVNGDMIPFELQLGN